MKLQILYKWGKDVFNADEQFKNWLHQPAYGLGNRIPANLMKTVTGLNLIINELKNIACGNFA